MESVTLSRAKKSLDIAKKVADNNRQLEDGKEYPINLSIIGAEKDSVECIQGTVTFKDGVGKVSPNLFEHLGVGASLSYKDNNITLTGKDAETFAVSSNFNGINIVGREKSEKENMKDIDGNHLKKEDLNLKNVKDTKNARFQLDNKALKQKRQEMQDLRAESNEIMNQQFQDQLRNMPRLMRLLQMLEDYNYKIANSQANAQLSDKGLNNHSVYDLYNIDKLHAQFHAMSADLTHYFHDVCSECHHEIEKTDAPTGKGFILGDVSTEESAVTMSLLDASTTIRSYMAPIIAANPDIPVKNLLESLGIPLAIYEYAETHNAKSQAIHQSHLDKAISGQKFKNQTGLSDRAAYGLTHGGKLRARRGTVMKATRYTGSKSYRVTSEGDAQRLRETIKARPESAISKQKTSENAEKTTGPVKAESPKGETKAEGVEVVAPKRMKYRLSTKSLRETYSTNIEEFTKEKPTDTPTPSTAKTDKKVLPTENLEAQNIPVEKQKQDNTSTQTPEQEHSQTSTSYLNNASQLSSSETSETTSLSNDSRDTSAEPTVTMGNAFFKNLRILSMSANPDFVGPMPIHYQKEYAKFKDRIKSVEFTETSTPGGLRYTLSGTKSLDNFTFDKQQTIYSDLHSKAGPTTDDLRLYHEKNPSLLEKDNLSALMTKTESSDATMDESRSVSSESSMAESAPERSSESSHPSEEPLDHTATDWESVYETIELMDDEQHHHHHHEHQHNVDPNILKLEEELSKLTLAQAQELEDLDASFDERTMRFVLKHLKYSREEMKKELYDYSNILQADKSLTPAKRKQKLLLEQDKIKKRQEKEFTDKLLKQKFLQRKLYAQLLIKHALAKSKYVLKLEQLADKCKANAKMQKRAPLLDEHFADAVDHVIMDMASLKTKIDTYAAELRAQGKFEEAEALESKGNEVNQMMGNVTNGNTLYNPDGSRKISATILKGSGYLKHLSSQPFYVRPKRTLSNFNPEHIHSYSSNAPEIIDLFKSQNMVDFTGVSFDTTATSSSSQTQDYSFHSNTTSSSHRNPSARHNNIVRYFAENLSNPNQTGPQGPQ